MKEVTEYKGLFNGYCPDCGSTVNVDYGFVPATKYCTGCGWTERKEEEDKDADLIEETVEVLVNL